MDRYHETGDEGARRGFKGPSGNPPRPDTPPSVDHPGPSAWDAAAFLQEADAALRETVELAGVRGEEAVPTHLARPRTRVQGKAWVAIRFKSQATYLAFQRAGLIKRTGKPEVFVLRRRWAGAFGDAFLDEAMCQAVAAELNAAFGLHLMAYSHTVLGRRR